MDRDIKVFNRPIMDKIYKRNQQLHMQRLKNIKSGTSNRTMPPSTFYPTSTQKVSNKKAIQKEEEKNLEIQKQNVLLFNRMMKIMRREDNNQPINHRSKNLYDSRQRFQSQMNRTAMQNSKISSQNKLIFDRLQQQKPTISNKKLKEQRMKKLNILKFMGKYPNNKAISAHRMSYDISSYENSRATGTSKEASNPGFDNRKKKLNTTLYYNYNKQYSEEEDPYMNGQGLDEEIYDEQMRRYQQEIKKMKQRDNQTSYNRRRFISQSMNRRQPNLNSQQIDDQDQDQNIPTISDMSKIHEPKLQKKKITEGGNNHENHEIVLFEAPSKVNNLPGNVRFTRNFNSYIIKALFSPETAKSHQMKQLYSVVIPQNEGNQFFSEFNYDFKYVTSMLLIEDDNLVIHVQPLKQENTQEHNMKEYRQNDEQSYEKKQEHSGLQNDENNEQPPTIPKQQAHENGEDQVAKFSSQNIAKYEEDLEVSID